MKFQKQNGTSFVRIGTTSKVESNKNVRVEDHFTRREVRICLFFVRCTRVYTQNTRIRHLTLICRTKYNM